MDKYLLRLIAVRFAAVVTVVSAIMSLENASRLASVVEQTGTPFVLLSRLMVSLLPEYLAIALPVASYLAPALAFRSLALRGEWQILGALGMSPARIMMVPMTVALVAAGAQLSVRLDLEPRGGRVLDDLISEIRTGVHGLSVRPGEAVALDAYTTLFADLRPGSDGRIASDVLIKRGGDVFSAAAAVAKRGADGGLILELRQGVAVHRRATGSMQSVRFDRFKMSMDPPGAGLTRADPFDRLDRLNWKDLTRIVDTQGSAPVGRRVTASLALRVSNAAFCLLLPWFAFAFGPPPRRGAGGPALMLGVVVIAIFLKTSDIVQAHGGAAPIATAVAHMTGWAAIAALTLRYVIRNGDGAWDIALAGIGHRMGRSTRYGFPVTPRTARVATSPVPRRTVVEHRIR